MVAIKTPPHNARRALALLVSLSCLTLGVTHANAQPNLVDADEAEREAALFGEPDDDADESDGATAPSDTRRDEDAMFGEDDGDDAALVTEDPSAMDGIAARLLEAEERLAFGGFLFSRVNLDRRERTPWRDATLSAPTLLDLYMDARPAERVRAYARGRLFYDPSLRATPAQAGESIEDQAPTMLGSPLVRERLRAQLDQLWVKFDVAQKVYVTAGRQRVRWGTGRFWNPTDFLNARQIDPLALFDERLGVDLVKLHWPVESLGWNFYAVAMLGEASRPADLGGALRAELLFGATELTLSTVVRREVWPGPQPLEPIYAPELTWPRESTPLRLGADLSAPLGPLDLRVEAALTRGSQRPYYTGELDLSALRFPQDETRADQWVAQVVGGAELGVRYNDGDVVYVAAEYFYNQAGYDDASLYLWLLVQGGFQPLYLGRHYAALAVILPAPGSWNDASFTTSALSNLSDRSFIWRLDASWTVLSQLRLSGYVMKAFGQYGELNYQVEVPPIPGQPALAGGLTLPAPDWTVGLALQLGL